MNKNTKRWTGFIYRDILLVMVSIIIILSGYHELMVGSPEKMNIHDVSKNWKLILEEGRFRKINVTVPFNYDGRKVLSLEKRLTPSILEEGNLVFYSENMAVLAHYDNYEIYRFGNESHFLKTKKFYGNKWNIIRLPLSAKPGEKLKITLIPNEPLHRAKLPKIYAANDYEFSSFLIRRNQFALLYSFLICIFSLISIGYYFVNKRNIKLSNRIIYVGLFAMLSFLWFFCKNPWIQYVFSNEELLKMISFIASCLMTVPVFWIVTDIPKFKYKKEVFFIIKLVLLYTILKLSAYTIFGRDVYDLLGVEIAAKAILGILFIRLLLKDYRLTRNSEVGNMIIPSLIFFAVLMIDMFQHWISIDGLGSSILEFGTVVCLLIMTSEAICDIKAAQNRSLWAEHYKSILGMDIMTGLENQNAFIQMTSALESYDELGVIAMDMNDLKKTNDTLGHAAGDELIIALAELMKDFFAEDFRKFRLGGDEFIILSKQKGKEVLEEMVAAFHDKIEQYNERNGTKLAIATGIAVYDKNNDNDLRGLLSRADENMYSRKVRMKIG